MEKKICAKGHFYDGDKYAQCPHCAEGRPPAVPSVFSVEKKETQQDSGSGKTEEKRKLFGRMKERRNKEHKGKTHGNAGVTEDRTQILNINAAGEKGSGSTGQNKGATGGTLQTIPIACSEEDGGHFTGAGQQNTSQGMSQEDIVTQEIGRAYMENTAYKVCRGETGLEYVSALYENSGHPEKSQPDRGIPEKDMERKTEKMEKNTAGNLQRTGGQNEGKTIGYFSTGLDREPPVGYLICIAGEDYGTGFQLKSGNNSIGRSGAMDIVIMDVKVSREKQAYVMYEPHKREFFLKPGDSSGLCYLNNEVLLEPKKLQAYDEILLGDTRLILIPVCGERFSWKE